MKHYKSVFKNEQELLKALLEIHIGSETFDVDPMMFKGNFYKEIPLPKHMFDLNPQFEYIQKSNAMDLPLESGSQNSIMLDPPFIIANRPSQKNYYSSKTHTYFESLNELELMYKGILKEAYRVLNKKGICIFKCQDFTDSKTIMTHALVYNWAIELGFYAKDLAILELPNKIYNGNTTQRHLRKTHTYFWVFRK